MYYKITDKQSEIYRQLHLLRTSEVETDKANRKAIVEHIGMDFDAYLGYSGQQNYLRTKVYRGFKFKPGSVPDKKIWAESRHEGFFKPNRRTKAGKAMSCFLIGLPSISYDSLFEKLKVDSASTFRFVFPYLEIFGDTILLYLDDHHEPKDPEVIEITKKEFEGIISSHKERNEG